MRKYPLPLLDLFHSFEAVARHRSFTLAAEELCVTQSAVSRQIKTLEDSLGLRLFRRKHRAIEVTAEGQRLFETVTAGLDAIASCLADLGAAAKAPQITVSASVAFAWFWLMPRLERFSTLKAEMDLRLLTADQPVLPGTGDVDVAILSGRANGMAGRPAPVRRTGLSGLQPGLSARPSRASATRRSPETRPCCIWNIRELRQVRWIGAIGCSTRV